jgi:DNA-binding LacI/PurR family transcriptional regulator
MLPPTLLPRLSDVAQGRNQPLHAQLRRALRVAIDEHFEDGQQFWSENVLIEHFGVSQITVRRALLDLTQEGALERRRAKGSYVRKTSEGGTLQIGCFVPRYDSEFINELLEHLSSVCRERKLPFRIHHTHRGENLNDIRRYLDAGTSQERFIILGTLPDAAQQLWDALDDSGYRCVCIDTPAIGRPAHFVGIDNETGIRLALEHLRELGHRRVIFLGNEPDVQPNIVAREQAFLELTADWGWSKSRIISAVTQPWENSYEAALRMMPQVWESRPTAIMTASDRGAWAVLGWLAENGIRVPQEVSVVGFDNAPHSEITYPSLTTIAHPKAAMVRWAVEILTTSVTKPQEIRLEPELIQRRSTGPAVTSDLVSESRSI